MTEEQTLLIRRRSLGTRRYNMPTVTPLAPLV